MGRFLLISITALLASSAASSAQVSPVCALMSGPAQQVCIMSGILEKEGGTLKGDWFVLKPRIDRLSTDFNLGAITIAHDWQFEPNEGAPTIGVRCDSVGPEIFLLGSGMTTLTTVTYAFGDGPIEVLHIITENGAIPTLPHDRAQKFYKQLLSGEALTLKISGQKHGEMSFALREAAEVLPPIMQRCGW